MGRTNPTFRDHLRRYRESWSSFRRALRRHDQAAFDRLFDRAREYADAAAYRNDPDPEMAVVVAMLLAHEREFERFDDHEARSDRVERRLDEVETRLEALQEAIDGLDTGD